MLGDLPVWDLSDLYKSHNDKKLSSDIKEVKSISKTFIEKYKGNLEQLNSSQLNEAINYYERINQILGKLYSYASLSFAINTDKSEYGQHYQKIKELGSEIYAQLVFFELEIMNLNKQSSQDHLASNYLKKWGPWLRRIFDRKPYQLSSDLEQFIAEKGPSGRGAWVRLFDESSSDLRFQFRDEVLSETEVLNLLSDPDPEIRKDAGLTFSSVLNQNKRTRSLIINTISRDKFIEDNKRGFKNPISSRNLENDVEDDVVNALAMAVTNRFSDLSHRYYKLKAKWFGKEKLNWWDRNAPLPNKPSQKWTWNEARNIVLNSFSELSPEIEKIAKKFFDNNWIDAKIRNGKDSGAFSHPCVPDVHPYILMNYNGKSRDVMTLAHELGHVINGDMKVLAIANFFVTFTSFLMQMFFWNMLFGGMYGGNRRQNGGYIIVIYFITMLVYFIGQLLVLALTRYREYGADRTGSFLSGKPDELASALEKISGTISKIPTQDLRTVKTASAFMIIPALSGDDVAKLLSTHPPVQDRVRKLRKMRQEMNNIFSDS